MKTGAGDLVDAGAFDVLQPWMWNPITAIRIYTKDAGVREVLALCPPARTSTN